MDKYHHELHINKHLYLSKFFANRYNDLLVADTLRILALSTISLFVPIYLLQVGFSLMEITVFELLQFVASIFLHYISLLYIPQWKVKRTLIASYIITILFSIALYYSRTLIDDFDKISFLVFVGLLNIFANIFYWSAHNIYFIKSTDAKDEGAKLGILHGIPTLISVAGPFIGSILITDFSFKAAFMFSAVLVGLASFVLHFSSNIRINKLNLDINKIFDFRDFKHNIIFIAQGISYAATAFVWPIFLFLLSIKLISVGLLFLFSNTAYALFCYLGGNISDKNGSTKIGKIGALGHSLSLIFRATVTTILALTTFQTMGGLFAGLMNVAFDTNFFKDSHEDFANKMMNRELYMHIGRIIVVIVLIVGLTYLSPISAFATTLVFSGTSIFLFSIFVIK